MTDLEAAETRLSFDDIFEAVQESKRGRWFLQEFESRLQKRDMQSVLQAISRLESRMESMGPQASHPDELDRVRNAIANARSDLLKLGLGTDAMTNEGRLFADMAEMARKAMPIAVDSNAGIVRTLQLVDEIDIVIAPPDRGARYFSSDLNLFERPPAPPKPVLVQAPLVKTEEPASTGAKLVIRRAHETAEIEPKPLETDIMVPPSSDMPNIDNPRIVIIRRKAEDMPDISAGEAEQSVSAA